MDVKSTFLNGDLKKEVFVKQPSIFKRPHSKDMVSKMALYGLRKTPLKPRLRDLMHSSSGAKDFAELIQILISTFTEQMVL